MSFVYAIDYWLFAAINGLAGRSPWLDAPARLLLNDYFVPTVLALALLALWFESKDLAGRDRTNQRAVLAATLSAILANTVLKGLNLLYFRPRPFAQHAVNLLFYHPTDSSFPSNAAALGFAIAAGVWFYNRTWGGGLLVIAGLFGLSRIFGGVHYPLDVLAGAAVGWSSAYFIYRQTCLLNRLLGFTATLAEKLGLI
ncbi:MAG: undecaprenyl-diphosphatase [Chloroflexota bacterium]|nr:MAG: undecaprenyl-diphosphatase [Chloroflexota bacterium]